MEPKRLDWKADYAHLQKAADTPGRTHFIVQCDRLGSQLFCMKLEYEHFPPRSVKNNLFDLFIAKWPPPEEDTDGFTLMWYILGIPEEQKHLAEKVAKECGLKIKEEIPIIFSNAKEYTFPMNGPRVFSIESNPKSRIYENDSEVFKKLREGEYDECRKILAADEQKLHAELKKEGFSPQQIKRILTHWADGDESYTEKPEGTE